MVDKVIDQEKNKKTKFGRDPIPLDEIQDPRNCTESNQPDNPKSTDASQFDYANSSSVAKAIRGLALI